MIVSIGCHLPTEHAQMGARISSAIIVDKLECFELGRHDDLREIGQVVQIDTSSSIGALYDMDFLSQGLHLTFDLTITTDSEVLSFGGFNSWSPPYVMNGNVVWP